MDYYPAQIISNGVNKSVKIYRLHGIDKAQAIQRLKDGKDVYTTKSKANTLAKELSQGQGSWKDDAHVTGGYRHYHDVKHHYRSHIFFGEPKAQTHEDSS
ncbi:hypothetical protein [Rhizobium leguminosarum]|uniref:Uncharacterized protein n=1 Tax=Rhizobium leguminosarum TaxID=384 RepID=A0A1B1CMI8_RHILE|nr:hypothetical protein [Rhizobium leguminosarum]ANP90974.1 hypothetical protein BA011_34340 [Rhizobium leguminosarum]API55163.1 hypothetical protein BMW22_26590 [Rhizobium leguminosarum]